MPARGGTIMPTCRECGHADRVTVSNLMQAWVCLRCRVWWRADTIGDLENGHNNHGAGQYIDGGAPSSTCVAGHCCQGKPASSLSAEKVLQEVKNIEIEQYVCPVCLQADALFKVHDERELIDGWGCHRCKSVQLHNTEYADVSPSAAAPVITPTAL